MDKTAISSPGIGDVLQGALNRAGSDNFSSALGYRSESQEDNYIDYNDLCSYNDSGNDDIF